VQLAFQSAKAESAVIMGQKSGGATQAATENTQQQRLEQFKAKTTSQINQLQSQIQALNAKIPKTPASKRADLISQRDTRGLEGDINRLAQTIPEVIAPSTTDPAE